MACARYRDSLNELAAGAPVPAGLEAHVAACAQCRTELAALRQLLAVADQQLAHLSVAEPSSSFVPRILAAAKSSGEASARRTVWLWPSLAATAAVVLAIILLVSRQPAPGIAVVETLPDRVPTPGPAVAGPVKTEAPPLQRRPPRSRPAEPQVLVPAAESRALVAWVALVNNERRSPVLLTAADGSSARPVAPASIEIQPIEIVPLDPAMSSGT